MSWRHATDLYIALIDRQTYDIEQIVLTSNGYVSPMCCVDPVTNASKAVDEESSLVSVKLLGICFTHAGCRCASTVAVPLPCPIYKHGGHQKVIFDVEEVELAIVHSRK